MSASSSAKKLPPNASKYKDLLMPDSQVTTSMLFYYKMKFRFLLNTKNCIFFGAKCHHNPVLTYTCTTPGSSLLSESKISANTFSLVVRECFGILILISYFEINQ